MPKEYTHWAIAGKALKRLGKNDPSGTVYNIIKDSLSLYMLGAVVFDTPFYYLGRHSGDFEGINRRLHAPDCQNPAAPIKDLFLYMLSHNDKAKLLPFLLGAVTHIYTDAVFHPFIFYHTGNCLSDDQALKRPATIYHRSFEGYLDLYYLSMPDSLKGLTIKKLRKTIRIRKSELSSLLGILYFNDCSILKKQINNALNIHTWSQILFQKRQAYFLMKLSSGLLGRLTRMDIESYLSLFYQPLNDYHISFFSERISYVHPVKGTEHCDLLAELENTALMNIIRIFTLIEEIYSGKKSTVDLDMEKIPSPETGLFNISYRDMAHFSKKYCF